MRAIAIDVVTWRGLSVCLSVGQTGERRALQNGRTDHDAVWGRLDRVDPIKENVLDNWCPVAPRGKCDGIICTAAAIWAVATVTVAACFLQRALAFDDDGDDEGLSAGVVVGRVERTAVVVGVGELGVLDHQNAAEVHARAARFQRR